MKIGFIGAGNMAEAIISGVCAKGIFQPGSIGAFDANSERLGDMCAQYGINAHVSNVELAAASDIVFLCVKPVALPAVLDEIAPVIGEKAVVSIAAGFSSARLLEKLGAGARVLRVMPNTPLLASCGMTVIETPSSLDEDAMRAVKSIFGALGKTAELPARLMDAVTGLSGSAPAFVYMFIDALKQAGVLQGLSAADALLLAAQTVKGSAQMVLETGKHPEALCELVCSPAGTTIEGVAELERRGFKGIVLDAVNAACEKSKRL